ncbi:MULTISPECIES: TIGR03936 family radical SAM-associated protein [unclassified Butyrivibrio]|uniref:TIGR03936 family radical SAM-associated protein n=1 Tax=unclassified Butyrivibrio TaxID=2639466 RepID=UPI0003B7A6EF|nr:MULTISPECIES: TIGR03936 family radical SAM-associated protein [unclassified Butyrivibrio]MDC7295244.1 TIGR03936 family radical SAM-associated protein [Butyrivibrio sp. DSM 10294]
MHKLRLKFSKNGPIKFIGHLDVMRYFQKAIRRADIDVKYSEGFSPHQVISFAQPLSVGATSDGEYMDMTVNSMVSTKDIMDRLNNVLNEGIKILAITELSERDEKAMTASFAARYRLNFRENIRPDFDWCSKFEEYLSQDKLPAMKKTKSGEKEIDMKPMIFEYCIDSAKEEVNILLSMSSSATLKPTLLFEGFFAYVGKEFNKNALAIHRVDIYKEVIEGEKRFAEPFISDDINERFCITEV